MSIHLRTLGAALALVACLAGNALAQSAGGGGGTVRQGPAASASAPWYMAPGTGTTWTVEPGNTANTTAWLMTLSQGGSAVSATNGIYTNLLQGNVVNSATNPFFAGITDGTNGPAAVKAASTAPAAADKASVVAISPNTGEVGTPETGVSQPTGGVGLSGWLSGIYNFFSNVYSSSGAASHWLTVWVENTIGGVGNNADSIAPTASPNAGTPVINYPYQYTGGNWNRQHICGSHVFKHFTTSGDNQILAASGSTNIYICDYSISFNGAANAYLEKSSSGTCSSPTQIDMAWYGIANAGEKGTKAYYTGLNTGASQQLCMNLSASVSADIEVDYDQY